MHISSVRIDLCKNTFRLVALGERNKTLVRKKFPRAQLLAYTANLPASRLEACTGAHFGGASYEDKVTKCGSSLPSSSNLTASQTRTTLSMPKPSLDSSKVVYCHRWGSSRSGAHPCLLARVGITNPYREEWSSEKIETLCCKRSRLPPFAKCAKSGAPTLLVVPAKGLGTRHLGELRKPAAKADLLWRLLRYPSTSLRAGS